MLCHNLVCQTHCISNAVLCWGHRALTPTHASAVVSLFRLWVFFHVFCEIQQLVLRRREQCLGRGPRLFHAPPFFFYLPVFFWAGQLHHIHLVAALAVAPLVVALAVAPLVVALAVALAVAPLVVVSPWGFYVFSSFFCLTQVPVPQSLWVHSFCWKVRVVALKKTQLYILLCVIVCETF